MDTFNGEHRGWATSILQTRFPGVAGRVTGCRQGLISLGYDETLATPIYGAWYNYCINGPRGEVEGVFVMPHVDGKNLAIMMCAVFVYGKAFMIPCTMYMILSSYRPFQPQGEGLARPLGSQVDH